MIGLGHDGRRGALGVIRSLITFAVGTALAGGPPHRSVLEELPHTAPTSGRTEPPPTAVVPTFGDATRGIRLCVRRETHRQTFPLVDPLPSTDSASANGPVLFARFVGTTGSSDSSETCMSAYGLRLRRPSRVPKDAGVSEVSRFSHMEFPSMHRVFDSAALQDGSRWRRPPYGLPHKCTRSARRIS